MSHIHLSMDSYFYRYAHKYEALYHALYDAILSGRIYKGEKLPSSRKLAEYYEISRGTVNQVYEMLIAEGVLETIKGSGTYVSFTFSSSSTLKKDLLPVSLSEVGEKMKRISSISRPDVNQPIHFHIGLSDMDYFPYKQWRRSLRHEMGKMEDEIKFSNMNSQKFYSLTTEIAKHLRHYHGLDCKNEQIVLVEDTAQSLFMLLQLLINVKEDSVVMEDPGYLGWEKVVLATGAQLKRLCVDSDGMQFKELDAKLAIVNADCHFPTGVALSLERKKRMLQWADKQEAFIIDAQYGVELCYDEKSKNALMMLDQSSRVIMTGTFSLTMMSSMKLGYIVFPEALIDIANRMKHLFDACERETFEQRALAHFMNTGDYSRHLNHMQRIYHHKKALFSQLFQMYCSQWFKVLPNNSATFILTKWNGDTASYDEAMKICEQEGTSWTDANLIYFERKESYASFSFAHLNEQSMEKGLIRLAFVLGKINIKTEGVL
ncbi:MocR-like pyridoxine biosynthesis transcription factor PdxR [Longirhabdus pacifica]|uniref:MocR-like pyridoxine biosynthesis transcription factor PdxR n=1 Tax=Longirhabdus pacifica TaxID=2305227 RepID=UPI001008D909|nr:PLP-dependent aminotransferase family protein [Longirhabdus pacifica]